MRLDRGVQKRAGDPQLRGQLGDEEAVVLERADLAAERNTIKRVTRELFRQTALPAIDCIVRLSKPVNSKAEPASNARLKAELRSELAQLLRAQTVTPTAIETR